MKKTTSSKKTKSYRKKRKKAQSPKNSPKKMKSDRQETLTLEQKTKK